MPKDRAWRPSWRPSEDEWGWDLGRGISEGFEAETCLRGWLPTTQGHILITLFFASFRNTLPGNRSWGTVWWKGTERA